VLAGSRPADGGRLQRAWATGAAWAATFGKISHRADVAALAEPAISLN